MAIRNSARWGIKPPRGAQLDRSHPHAAGLFDLLLYNEGGGPPANLAAPGAASAISGSPTWEATTSGFGLKAAPGSVGTGGSGSCATVPDHGNLAAGDFAVRVVFRLDAAWPNTYTGLVEKKATGREFAVFINTSGNIQYVGIGGADTDSVGIATGMTAVGAVYDLVIVRKGSALTAYVNGVSAGTAAASFAATAAAAGAVTYVGGQGGGNANPGVTVIDYRTWLRAPAAAEVSSWAAHSYGPILPPTTRRFLPPPAGGALAGSASLAGLSTLAAAGSLAVPGSAGLASVSTLSAAGSTAVHGSASLASVATLAAAGSAAVPGASALASVSTLAASGSLAVPGATSLASLSTLAAAGLLSVRGSAALASVATLAAAGSYAPGGAGPSAALGASSSLVAAGSLAVHGSAVLAAVSTLHASADPPPSHSYPIDVDFTAHAPTASVAAGQQMPANSGLVEIPGNNWSIDSSGNAVSASTTFTSNWLLGQLNSKITDQIAYLHAVYTGGEIDTAVLRAVDLNNCILTLWASNDFYVDIIVSGSPSNILTSSNILSGQRIVGEAYWYVFSATGTNPTTIDLYLYADGPRPTIGTDTPLAHASVADSTSVLQAAGWLGLAGVASDTNIRRVVLDNAGTSPPPPPPPPPASFVPILLLTQGVV